MQEAQGDSVYQQKCKIINMTVQQTIQNLQERTATKPHVMILAVITNSFTEIRSTTGVDTTTQAALNEWTHQQMWTEAIIREKSYQQMRLVNTQNMGYTGNIEIEELHKQDNKLHNQYI
jgi:hypothetical protein